MAEHKKTALATGKPLKNQIKENWQLYLMLAIPLILTLVYKYIPMYGIQIAFRDYKASRGFAGSKWVGMKWFSRFFNSPNAGRMIKNTFLLSLYSLLWGFPVPIILALLLNQLANKKLKRVTQTVLYAPHFISIMIVCGMIRIFLSPSGGLLNLLLGTQTDFMAEASAFRPVYIISGIWQDAGWGCIIYLATLGNIDSDGAYINIDTSDEWDFTNIQCFIQNDDQLDKIKSMSKGDAIVIKGEVTDVGELLGYTIDIDSIE